MNTPTRPHLRIFVGEACGLWVLALSLGTLGWFQGLQALLGAGVVLLPWAVASTASALAERRRGSAADREGPDPQRALIWIWAPLCVAAAGVVAFLAPIAPVQVPPTWAAPLLAFLALGSGVLARYHQDTPGLPEAAGLATWARWGLWSLGLSALVLAGRTWGVTDFAAELWWETAWVNALCTASVALLAEGLWTSLRGARPLKRPSHMQLGWAPFSSPLLLRLFFSSLNPVSSLFDTLENLSGIDIKGTWAIQVLRRSLEPLAITLALLGWLSTGLTMVDVHEQGVREHLGVPDKQVLEPGLHLSWPWPVDTVHRLPTERVQTMKLGHGEAPEVSAGQSFAWLFSLGYSEDQAVEEEEESRLWAKQHAAEEYTLLLGDGRDLVSVDGLLHYRIADPHAWLYNTQNPEQAVKSAAYRALMLHTSGKGLEQALSENLQSLAGEIRDTIQQSIADQGLGVEIVDFTLSALHPPVLVATDYQSVVSAQIDQQRMLTEAQGYRLGRLPLARSEALEKTSQASADAATRLAQARGEAAAFSAVEQSHQASPSL
ncbi:MAG: regulator of protease activity HflC (stomatin/prohibitin superfamily), partial [Cognaticolwellia sp.]